MRLLCEGDDSVWMLWTPPDRVRKLDAEQARALNLAKISLTYISDIDRFMIENFGDHEVKTELNQDTLVDELVGRDYECPEPHYAGGQEIYGIRCTDGAHRSIWLEIIDSRRKLRGRFRAVELAVARNGTAIAVLRRGGKNHIVRATLR